MKPKFQFSSLLSKKCTERLVEIIEQLGGSFIDSKTYSSKATHLVIEKLDCTEKILCFIAAGKWIVTNVYLEDCLKANRFLSEENYHISKYFPKSKLALVSYEWREKILRDKTQTPFDGWKVACMLDDEEKTQGITRIIQSGHGEAVKVKPNSRMCSKTGTYYSIVLYDEKLKNDAKLYAHDNKIPYFPLQAIPDYLMQCTKHTKPILSSQYYENLSSNSFSKNRRTGGLQLKVKEVNDSFIFATFENLLYFANVASTNKLNFVNTEMENQFVNLWNNNAFNEALNLLTMIEPNKLPSENVMILLFEFILENSFSKTKKSFSFLPILGSTNVHNILYSSVNAYLKNVLLYNPPNSFEVIKHYKKVFENLFIDLRIKETFMKASGLQGLIDVLHWMSIHDFLLMNISKEKNRFHHCILSIFKLSEDGIKLRIIKALANEESNIPSATFFKMVQILAVCHTYSANSEFYSKILDLFKEKSWSAHDFMAAPKYAKYQDSFRSLFKELLVQKSNEN